MIYVPFVFFLAFFALLAFECAVSLARDSYRARSQNWRTLVAIWETPTAQAPTAQAPTAQAPTAQAPTAQAPTAQAPTAQAHRPGRALLAFNTAVVWG